MDRHVKAQAPSDHTRRQTTHTPQPNNSQHLVYPTFYTTMVVIVNHTCNRPSHVPLQLSHIPLLLLDNKPPPTRSHATTEEHQLCVYPGTRPACQGLPLRTLLTSLSSSFAFSHSFASLQPTVLTRLLPRALQWPLTLDNHLPYADVIQVNFAGKGLRPKTGDRRTPATLAITWILAPQARCAAPCAHILSGALGITGAS